MARIIAALFFCLLCTGTAFSQSTDERAEPHQRHRGKELVPVYQAQTVCANQVPRGWIRTNDRWDPTTCGKPTTISYNVWTIEKYHGRPVGSIMRVCSDIIPRGWVMIDSMWNPTMCGHPTAMTKNVMTIKRVE